MVVVINSMASKVLALSPSPRRRAVALQSGNSAKLGHYWLVNL